MQWATTSWTQVLAARDAPSSEARQALEGLCQAYWYPLYVFVRHQGFDAEEARDLTQAYFAELIEKGYLADFDPELGRFRVFLKTSIKPYEELLDRLRAVTNLRVVPDEQSAAGYRIELGPFPGWAKVPEW